jgi:hypothetical protein
LDEILEWCKQNDEKCNQIAINASLYMSQFLNVENEKKLHKKLFEWYNKNITFIE